MIPGGDDMVQCYSRTDDCIGSSRFTTRTECCDNRGKEAADFGFSVRTDGEGCRRCPNSEQLHGFVYACLINHPPFLLYGVFGFAQTIFTQHERGQGYQIEAGFLSGRPETGLVSNITLEAGDAGNYSLF